MSEDEGRSEHETPATQVQRMYRELGEAVEHLQRAAERFRSEWEELDEWKEPPPPKGWKPCLCSHQEACHNPERNCWCELAGGLPEPCGEFRKAEFYFTDPLDETGYWWVWEGEGWQNTVMRLAPEQVDRFMTALETLARHYDPDEIGRRLVDWLETGAAECE